MLVANYSEFRGDLKKFLDSVEFNNEGVTINCKKLAKLCDNHTQKLLKDRKKLLQSENEEG